MHAVSPKLVPWLADLNQRNAALIANGYLPTAISAREGLAGMTFLQVQPGPPLAWVNDELIPGPGYTVPVRIYHPAPTEERAVIVFLHGGGHMAGGVSVYDPVCRRLAAATGQVVVSAEYRLAPENPYPAGLNDGHTVARGVWAALERRQLPYRHELTLIGDSGGGALCASISTLAQFDPALRISNQVLIYPSLDYTLSLPSIQENAEGYLLHSSRVSWYFDNYFQHSENRRDASPLHAPFIERLPRTLIVSAGFDPLRDEAIAYQARLQQAGVVCERLHFDDMVHAFLNLENLVADECAAVYRRIAGFLQGD